MLRSIRFSKLWQRKEHLQQRVDVARIAKILQANKARPAQWNQGFIVFRDGRPFESEASLQ
jgi:hypothetical protein